MARVLLLLSDGLHRVVRMAVILCLSVMFLVVMFQVVSRYALNSPPAWAEEVARYTMIWLGLLGATMSFKTRMDAVLMKSVFPERPHPLGWLGEALRAIAVVTFLGPVIYYSFIGVSGSAARGFLARQYLVQTDTLGIPIVWVAVSVPLCAIIILIHLAARAWHNSLTCRRRW